MELEPDTEQVKKKNLTVHQLLFFHGDGEPSTIALQMQGKNVKASTTLVALHGKRSSFMLHRKVISDGTRSIANKVERGREPLCGKEFAEEIVEGALSKRIHQGLLFASDQRTDLENGRRAQVRGQRLVASGTLVHFHCSLVIDTLRSRDLRNISADIGEARSGVREGHVRLPS